MNRIAQHDIDRLVDDELASDDRRELLILADRADDGWKRVALGFLEAQALRADLRKLDLADPVTTEPATPGASTPPASTPPASASGSGRWRVMSIAASWLILFGIGLEVGRQRVVPVRAPVAIAPENQTLAPGAAASRTIPAITTVTSPAQHIDQWWKEASTMDPALQQWIQSSGHNVQRKFELVPLRLKDGWHGILPVEHVRITPASAPEIQ